MPADALTTMKWTGSQVILADTDAEHVLICLHHPPLPVGSKWLDQVGLKNGDEFLRIIGRPGNVRAAIFGHVHQEFEGAHDAIRYYRHAVDLSPVYGGK